MITKEDQDWIDEQIRLRDLYFIYCQDHTLENGLFMLFSKWLKEVYHDS